MIQRSMDKRQSGEGGFTLVELLVVIVILGILAAIVVFAVGGITDKGEEASCEADTSSLATAEEANYAQNGAYVDEDILVENKFLHKESVMHNITTDGATYDITDDEDHDPVCTDNTEPEPETP